MTGEPTWFEIGVADAARARTFYGSLLGWEFTPGPNGSGAVIGTAGLSGGLHGGDDGAAPYLFFAVDDVEAALERVRALGGEPERYEGSSDEATVAEFGRFALCRDDQGSPFGLHEPPRQAS
jgi:predicted enzyme related to lactoylglutathione lyase